MWQVTWMLSLLPDWLWTALLISSTIGLLASLIVKRIPFINNYRFPIQAVSFIGLLVSIWFLGAASANEVWQSKVKDMEEKVKLAEEQAANKNVEVQEKIVEKTKVIREKGKTQIQYVDRVISQDKEIVKYVENCPVPKLIIDELNKAAEGTAK